LRQENDRASRSDLPRKPDSKEYTAALQPGAITASMADHCSRPPMGAARAVSGVQVSEVVLWNGLPIMALVPVMADFHPFCHEAMGAKINYI
jgi:hypothetical protein